MILDLHKAGKTIILVTHDMNIVLNYATDAVVLNKGKVVFEGKPHQIFAGDVEALNIDVPPIYYFAKQLLNNGLKINIENIKSVDDLFNEIRRAKDE